MDDWILPIMALARFSEQAREEIRRDDGLRAALAALDAADPLMFSSVGSVANSQAGCHFNALVTNGVLPIFAVDRDY